MLDSCIILYTFYQNIVPVWMSRFDFDLFDGDTVFNENHLNESLEKILSCINKIIEKSVHEAPEHYLWHHRRFKSQAPEIYD